jgi:hypothetical protein
MKKYDPIAEYCKEWVRWLQTRRFYGPRPARSTLARLQPSKSAGQEPNARNHPGMQYFNMAIHTLADMPEWKREWPAFQAHYLGAGLPAKTAADNLGIGRRTYYDHIKRFSDAAYSMAHSIMRVQEQMTPANAEERLAADTANDDNYVPAPGA